MTRSVSWSILTFLPPARKSGGFLARHVGGIAFQHHGAAGPPLVLQETERAGAYRIADALVGRRRRQPRRHHDRQRRIGLAQHLEQQRERLLQHELEGLGIGGVERRGVGHQHLAQRVAHRPALERGHAILCGDRIAVVPLEAVAQHERPAELVGAAVVALDHLRLDLALLVHGEQHVEDVQAEGARDGRRDDMRIEDGDLRFEHHRHRLGRRARRAGPHQRGRPQARAAGQHRPTPQTVTHTDTPMLTGRQRSGDQGQRETGRSACFRQEDRPAKHRWRQDVAGGG